ncbi:MAG: FAD:protein FMN transferase [bacterium]
MAEHSLELPHRSTSRRVRAAGAFFAMVTTLFLVGCGEPQPVSRTFTIGGTTGTVWVATQLKSRLADAVDLAESTVRRSMKMLDASDAESQISQINRMANLSQAPLSGDIFRVIDLAYYYTGLTDGAFDITTAPLLTLWGFGTAHVPAEIPTEELIDAARSSMGKDHAVVSSSRTMVFTTPLTRIDPGELTRSYAVDLGILQFRRNKITSAMITFGNTVRCEGAMSKLQPWSIPLHDPTSETNVLGLVTLPEAFAVHTASLYERFVTIGGRKYGHIMDPRTGHPAEGTLSVSVMGPTATQSGALAQALVILGLDKCASVLDGFPRHDVLIIPDRQPVELWMTKGFAIRFKQDPGFKGTIHIIEQPETAAETPAP